jgi:hypothetical protein
VEKLFNGCPSETETKRKRARINQKSGSNRSSVFAMSYKESSYCGDRRPDGLNRFGALDLCVWYSPPRAGTVRPIHQDVASCQLSEQLCHLVRHTGCETLPNVRHTSTLAHARILIKGRPIKRDSVLIHARHLQFCKIIAGPHANTVDSSLFCDHPMELVFL